VADGQTLWLHDVDLNQVTARKQEQVLGSTPAASDGGGARPEGAGGISP
jgi:outer membrane lipoprotein carrier protein